MQPLQICIGPTIRIGQDSWCLPYAGFFYSLYGTVWPGMLKQCVLGSADIYIHKKPCRPAVSV